MRPQHPRETDSRANLNARGCLNSVASQTTRLPRPHGWRELIRLVAPPQFGKALLHVLSTENPEMPPPEGSSEERVQRGAKLFGIDLVAFANRMIPGRMPAGGDRRDHQPITQTEQNPNFSSC